MAVKIKPGIPWWKQINRPVGLKKGEVSIIVAKENVGKSKML